MTTSFSYIIFIIVSSFTNYPVAYIIFVYKYIFIFQVIMICAIMLPIPAIFVFTVICAIFSDAFLSISQVCYLYDLFDGKIFATSWLASFFLLTFIVL